MAPVKRCTEKTEPEWVMAFCKAVYPEYTELAMAVGSEKSILIDATELITELRAENERLRAAAAMEKGDQPMNDQNKPFEQWAIIELFGHNMIAGYVSEQIIAGAAFVRVDVPDVIACPDASLSVPGFTKLFGPAAIYAITPTDETTARQAAVNLTTRPVSPWIVPDGRQRLPPPTIDKDEIDEDEDEPDDCPY